MALGYSPSRRLWAKGREILVDERKDYRFELPDGRIAETRALDKDTAMKHIMKTMSVDTLKEAA